MLWGWPNRWLNESDPAESASVLLDVDLLLATNRSDSQAHVLRTLALAYSLPDLASKLSSDEWWKLVEGLYRQAREALGQPAPASDTPRSVLEHQLVAGELPLALSYLFPEVHALHELRDAARAVFSEALVELTDGQGLPHGRLLPVYAPLFACWTRARWLGGKLKRGAWSRAAEAQYEWMVRHSVRLANANGNFMLCDAMEDVRPRWPKRLFEVALDLAGDSAACAAAKRALPSNASPKQVRFDKGDLPHPSFSTDWSGISVLASGWSRRDVRLAVAFTGNPLRIELATGRETVFAGDWTSETTCDDARVEFAGDWEELCWESDRRCDYLELGIQLTQGLRLERQIVFGREDRVLYLCDAVFAPESAPRRLRHTMSLPLAAGVQWRPEIETRDGVLAGKKQLAAVLPLGLHEWRNDPRGGSLTSEASRLILTQESVGRALCCPLLIDFKSRRLREERTWRQLTVAESLEVVPRDVAVGFRGQLGPDQWLFYRSLGPAANRTLLGQNYSGEFAAGRFLPTGKMKPWIEIEPC